MDLFRGHRVGAIAIGAPQQQQIAQALQPGRRTRLNHGVGALSVQLHRGDHPDRIPFREAATETRGHQHIADANIGIRRQMLKLEIVSTAVTGGNHANVVTQDLDRQRMGGIADQQHPAGHFRHGHDLPHYAFIADNRLAFVNTVHAAFVNNHLIAVRVVDR